MITHISTFESTLKLSLTRAIKQLPLMFITIGSLALFFVKDILLVGILFAVGYLLGSKVGTVFQLASLIGLIYVLIKFDGSLGMALAFIGKKRTDYWKMAQESFVGGIGFFTKALRAGVVLFFGQTLMVCPCFLFLSNFICSPYLLVYEGIKGKDAEERSVQLAKNYGWTVFASTAQLLLISYMLIFLSALLFLTSYAWLGIILVIFFCLFLGLLQSNFVYQTYLELQHLVGTKAKEQVGRQTIVAAGISVLFILVFYLAFRIFS